ncbi:hypothetical protein QA612_06865 [Evansella sp. AB-P1]|uniref:hypothetical protein n=1 Tax=Evansella sp. AB-P1 TaxID=3037653 RepID=UPI00241C37A2|nr:hypothetical protein [Evansella sp. AB-P1]MDG5787209.1 hypothetical protein [Evansella sp. AB-P1]
MNVLLKKFVGENHESLEVITSSGEVPLSWSKPYDKKIRNLEELGAPEHKIIKLRTKALNKYLAKLKHLERYLKQTNLVEDEKTRRVVLSQLQIVRQRWEEDLSRECS